MDKTSSCLQAVLDNKACHTVLTVSHSPTKRCCSSGTTMAALGVLHNARGVYSVQCTPCLARLHAKTCLGHHMKSASSSDASTMDMLSPISAGVRAVNACIVQRALGQARHCWVTSVAGSGATAPAAHAASLCCRLWHCNNMRLMYTPSHCCCRPLQDAPAVLCDNTLQHHLHDAVIARISDVR
jgi:hypothetical protein